MRLKAYLGLTALVSSVILALAMNRQQGQKEKPNVLLITIDALRPDHLSCYGYKRLTSSYIDGLAKEGVLFTQAIAQSSTTVSSIGTILTSNYMHTHLLSQWGDSLNHGLKTIPGILRSRGYRTFFIGGNKDFLVNLRGFKEGFDAARVPDWGAYKVTERALKFLKLSNNPFFLWVHYMDVHAPYAIPPSYVKIYTGDKFYDRTKTLPIVKNILGWYGYKGIPESLADKHGKINNPDYYIACYDAAISCIDAQVARIVAKLKELGLYEKTLVIITSDHGQMLGEKDLYFNHGWFLYEPLIKVPLIVKYEGVIPKSTTVNTQVSAHLDIMPTILDILKIDIPLTAQGSSLTRVISENKKSAQSIVFAESLFSKCLRTQDWKLIYNTSKKQYGLFNLRDDPDETNNLVTAREAIFESLRPGLDAFIRLDARRPTKDLPYLDERSRERLRSIGYLQ